jgi:hypothetical protein
VSLWVPKDRPFDAPVLIVDAARVVDLLDVGLARPWRAVVRADGDGSGIDIVAKERG